jgi:hypothetical protein
MHMTVSIGQRIVLFLYSGCPFEIQKKLDDEVPSVNNEANGTKGQNGLAADFTVFSEWLCKNLTSGQKYYIETIIKPYNLNK